MLAARLYEKHTLSLGQAAELAGYSRRTFMGLLPMIMFLFSTILQRN
ncbi:UPF0175 family protein [Ilyomonas limi]